MGFSDEIGKYAAMALFVIILIVILYFWLFRGSGLSSIFNAPSALINGAISGISHDVGSKQTKKNVNKIGHSLGKLGHL
jgi:hypothetical protein